MCGRYVSPDTAAIEAAWHIGRRNSNPFRRCFNVAPTQTIPIIRADKDFGEPLLVEARWGFVPGWWKQAKPPGHCFNARAEEAASKPMWHHPFRTARCLIPAVGWYEWSDGERADPATGEIKRYRQPHFIFRPDRQLVCFAGLMSFWYPDTESSLLTCAIVTRSATPSVAEVHDRMPAVLQEEDFARWLDQSVTKPEEVAGMIEAAQGDFAHYTVSTRLNAAKTDEEALLEPI